MAVMPVHLTPRPQPASPTAARRACSHDGASPAPQHRRPAPSRARWLMVVLLVVITLSVGAQLLRPHMAVELADMLPVTWLKTASSQVQSRLDVAQLGPSIAPAQRVESLNNRFASLSVPSGGASPYRLLFRHGGLNGAFTYALPDGSIVISDELLELLPDDNQILALLCHELGHLHYRHVLYSSLEGDVFSLWASTLLGQERYAVPRLSAQIMTAELSTDEHLLADQFALTMLTANNLPANSLLLALQRLAQTQPLGAEPPSLLRPLPPASMAQRVLRLQRPQ